MGHAFVPLDETLAMVAVDLSGRSYASVDISLSQEMVENLPGDLVSHFLESFAAESRITLHAKDSERSRYPPQGRGSVQSVGQGAPLRR